MRGIITGLLLCVAHFSSSQTDAVVVAGEAGQQAVKFSNETKYAIVTMTAANKTKVLLTFPIRIFFSKFLKSLKNARHIGIQKPLWWKFTVSTTTILPWSSRLTKSHSELSLGGNQTTLRTS